MRRIEPFKPAGFHYIPHELPEGLDPQPREVVALAERADWLADCCDNYKRYLEGRPVALIFDEGLAWITFRDLLNALQVLGDWTHTGTPLADRATGRGPLDPEGWPEDEAWWEWGHQIFLAHLSVVKCLAGIVPRVAHNQGGEEHGRPYQIRWSRKGNPDFGRVWYAWDWRDLEARRIEDDCRKGVIHLSQCELECAIDARGMSDPQSEWYQPERGTTIFGECPPPPNFRDRECPTDIVADHRYRQIQAARGKAFEPISYEWDDFAAEPSEGTDHCSLPVEVEVTPEMRFPPLALVEEVKEWLGEYWPERSVLDALDSGSCHLREDLADSVLCNRRLSDGRTLRFELARWPGYLGADTEPLSRIRPYDNCVHEVGDIFEAAQNIEVTERVKLPDLGDPAWLVCEYHKYRRSVTEGKLAATFQAYALHRFPKLLTAVELPTTGKEPPPTAPPMVCVKLLRIYLGVSRDAIARFVKALPDDKKQKPSDRQSWLVDYSAAREFWRLKGRNLPPTPGELL